MMNKEGDVGTQDHPNGGPFKIFTVFFAVAFALYHILALQFFAIDPMVLRAGFLAGSAVLTFLYWRSSWKRRGVYLDILLGVGCLASAVYLALTYKEMVYRVGITPTMGDTAFGVIAILVTLEIARRTLGWGLPVLAVLVILYALLGQYLPGGLGHGGFSFERTVSILFSASGIFGIPISVSITYVLPFVIFGAFLEKNGTGAYIMELSKAIAGRSKGGAAKIATVSSAMFGSINGSPVANVVSTGVITIPMMKKGGYKPEFAGAVEAVASTGGQILPPVMGASAFIMVELLGTSYSTIALAALIPAILYYVAVYWVIDLEAGKIGLKGLPKEAIPSLKLLLRQKGHLLLPLLVLVIALLGFGLSPMRSALIGIVSAIVFPAFSKETRLSLREILGALELGAKNTVTVTTATAAAGIIVGVLGMTGLGHQFASIILSFSGNILFVALILTAVVALVLGVGMPTTGAYIVTASILPTALLPLGVNPLAIHLFLLYFANISNITPPVALASFAAAGLAETSSMKVGMKAFQLGLVGFIIPFMFVYSPALLMQGTPLEIFIALVTSVIGVLALGMAIQGWYKIKLAMWQRGLLAIGSVCLIDPGFLTDIIGITLIVAVLLTVYRERNVAYPMAATLEEPIEE